MPDSKSVNQRLGHFYYENGQREKGLDLLRRNGLVARVARLDQRPKIDGQIDDPAWHGIEPLSEFYQCIWKRSAYPIEGQAEVYLGYWNNSLFIAMRGFEPQTDNLTAAVTQDDERGIYRDDCVELFIDPDRGTLRTYYHLVVNSIGTMADKYRQENGNWDMSWNAPRSIATHLEQDAWILEGEFPATAFAEADIAPGDIWNFNIARVRIANASEYGQWVPTYGNAHRPDHFGLLVFD